MPERPQGPKTRQGFAKTVPMNNATALRLAITCTDCGALRVFEVNRALKMLHEREIAHMQVDTGCEVCGTGVQVALFWDIAAVGYSYAKLPLGDAMRVEDPVGLRAPVRDEQRQKLSHERSKGHAMLTPAENTAWNTYVAEMAQRGMEVDLEPLILALHELAGTAPGRVIGDALGVGTVPYPDLAKRLTLQTRSIITTGHVPT